MVSSYSSDWGVHTMINGERERVLVLGATGGLGRLVCEELCRAWGPGSVIVGDRNADRGRDYARELGIDASSRCIDVMDPTSVDDAIDAGLLAVIVAVQQVEPIVQTLCIQRGVPCLDVTIGTSLIGLVRALDSEAKANEVASVVTAGLFPGLSGVMARLAAESVDDPSSIDVGLLQSSNGSAGSTGIADMLSVFATPAVLRKAGTSHPVRGFTAKRQMRFPLPFGTKDVRLIDYAEADLVAEVCEVHDVNYWSGYDKTSFHRLIVGLNSLRILELFKLKATRRRLARLILRSRRKTSPTSETIALTVEVNGQLDGSPATHRLSLLAPSDYGATAMAVVAMTKLLAEGNVKVTGVCAPVEAFELDSLLEAMDCDQISVQRLD